MRIEKMKITGSFRYLWLKTVEDVDLSQHCARCLIGKYDDRFKKGSFPLDLEDKVYYLCGVSAPFKWADNFHLAFMPADAEETVSVAYNGIEIEISGARRLPIEEQYIPMAYPHAQNKAYSTCRNWQFAHYFSKELKK